MATDQDTDSQAKGETNDVALSRVMPQTYRAKILLVLLIIGFLLLPPIYTTSKIGIQAIFNFFQQDAFYYIAVAQNSTNGFYSFDGERTTNGFHPLWQYLLTFCFGLFQTPDQAFQIEFVFWVSVIFVIVGYCLAGLAIFEISGSVLLSFLVVPGLLNVALSFILRWGGSPWKYMNGMESSLSVFFFGILLCFIAAQHNNPWELMKKKGFLFGFGIVVGFMILSRLDDVFLLPAFFLSLICLGEDSLAERFEKGILVCGPGICMLIPYLVFNYQSVGTPLPISGVSKGDISLWVNLLNLWGLLFPEPFQPGTLYADIFATEVYKQALMWVSLTLSFLFLGLLAGAVKRGRLSKQQALLVFGLLLYIPFKVLYNLVNVHVNHQGIWYFVVPTLVINFGALFLLAHSSFRFSDLTRWAQTGTLVSLVFYLAFYLATTYKGAMYTSAEDYALWSDRQQIARYLRDHKPNIRIVEFHDGVIGYSLGIPTIHGLGFVIDYEGLLAIQAGRFLEYCYSRGFNTLATIRYLPIQNPRMTTDEIVSRLKGSYHLHREPLGDFEFRVLLYHAPSHALFVEFRPRRGLEP
ncbi:MAG: hypothetical protein AB1473_08410 [Thermodesulfobacteriota bacterium]